MSDNSIPASSGQQPTPPPPPAQPYGSPPAAPPHTDPGVAPTYGVAPAYGTPPRAYGTPQQGGYTSAYPTPNYTAARPTSGLAVTSLICGIAGVVLFWAILPLIASIVAVITGHMALRQTKANPAIGGRGMAIAGVVMGYVMVGFLAVGIVMTILSFVFVGVFSLPFLFVD